MKYVAAYMLAAMTATKGHGHHEHTITVSEIENILGSVGVDCDKHMAQTVVDRFSGRPVEDLIQQGLKNLCAVSAPSAGAVAPAATGASGDAPAAAAAGKPVEQKKEEKKEEESDDDMGFGLFD